MSKKMKGAIWDSITPSGVGSYEDDRARLKYQNLMQDYQELRKEVDMMRRRLDAGKHKKRILAAEVRFLRKRFGYLVKTKSKNLSQEEKLVQPPNLHKKTKHTKEFCRKVANLHMLPPIPEVIPKKKQYSSKKVALHHSKVPTVSVLDLNKKERMHDDTITRVTSLASDLNQDRSFGAKEASLPSRAPIFDLNEISTGDEDFQTNAGTVKFEEFRSLMRHPDDEVMLPVCRNAGEGSSRVGKRKISWQDPVALRV